MASLRRSCGNSLLLATGLASLTLATGGCESTPPGGGNPTTGALATMGGTGAAAPTGNLGGSSTTGTPTGMGGTNAAGMTSTMAGQSTTGSPTAGQTSTGGGMGPMGGSPSGGNMPMAGTSSAGLSSGGAGASTGGAGGGDGGAGGAEGGSGGECTREFLDGLLDDYFAALSAGDASTLPLAANVKFTENAEEVEIGTTDFWMDAGDVVYSQVALDTTACSVAAQAVVPEGSTDLPIAIRIKVENGEMTEIETIVVRQGDYTASFAVDNDTGAIIDIADDIGWHDEVPEADRATREELTSWIDTYFRAFPNGVCDTTSACRRLENGGGDFSCGSACSGGSGGFEPRVIVVDEVRGIATGFTVFDFMTVGHLDMHMAKMYGGQVHAVHAILRDTGGESGWD